MIVPITLIVTGLPCTGLRRIIMIVFVDVIKFVIDELFSHDIDVQIRMMLSSTAAPLSCEYRAYPRRSQVWQSLFKMALRSLRTLLFEFRCLFIILNLLSFCAESSWRFSKSMYPNTSTMLFVTLDLSAIYLSHLRHNILNYVIVFWWDCKMRLTILIQ